MNKKIILANLILIVASFVDAMPTQKEIERAGDAVALVMSDSRKAFKAGGMTHAEFADACVAFAGKADGEAVKYLLLSQAFHHYVKAGEYDEAEGVLGSLMSEIRDFSVSLIAQMIDKAVPYTLRKDVPQLMRIKKAAKSVAKNQALLPDLVKAVKKQPDNSNAQEQLGLCYARCGDWSRAVVAFAKTKGELARMARAEVARSKPMSEVADFWRSYNDGEISCLIHAASLYREFLKSLDASDFARIYVKRRIREIEANAEVDAYRLVMGLGGADHNKKRDDKPNAMAGLKRSVSNSKAGRLYCVIDLSGGANARTYPVTYLDKPSSGGFNTNEYKTRKLVLRRCPAGSDVMSGRFVLTKDFYVGIFAVTQRQWELVMGNNPSFFAGDTHPVECVSYDMIRGSQNGAQYPRSTEVDPLSFLGRLRDKTGLLDLDLPTESQWEHACRAGTTTIYNTGSSESALNDAGWYSGNSNGTTHPVGEKRPNAWGLYDMHGNVWEWCANWYGSPAQLGMDPVGRLDGKFRVQRGGRWNADASVATSSCPHGCVPGYRDRHHGLRLCLTIEKK